MRSALFSGLKAAIIISFLVSERDSDRHNHQLRE